MFTSGSVVGVVTFLVLTREICASTPGDSTLNICDSTEEITLPDTGLESFKTIDLNPLDDGSNTQCTLKITASDTHYVFFRFQENDLELHRLMSGRHQNNRPCKLSIYVQDVEDKPFWSGDICSLDKLPDSAHLLTPKIKLVWEPADNAFHAKGRKIIVNSVGTGDYCKRSDQHVCMRIGWQPSLCISSQLLCDKREDCPKGSQKNDEDEQFCREYVRTQSTWKKMVADIYKKVKDNYDVDKILEQFDFTTQEPNASGGNDNKKVVQWKNWKEIRQLEVITTTPHPPPPKTLLGFIISQYGPWGYVLIGVLLFGTTLIFWGMWECCIRKHRAEHNVIAASQLNSPTTAVLIVNGYEDPHAVQPPEYEDLDLPPSYAALFPHEDKASDDEDDEGRAETIPLDSISVGTRNRSGGTSEEDGNT